MTNSGFVARSSQTETTSRRGIFTIGVAGERFGLPIECVRTVFRSSAITPVPLAPPRILGLINLRGHVVTAICIRGILDMVPAQQPPELMVAIEYRNEGFALAVDSVGDVLEVTEADRVELPLSVVAARRAATVAAYRTLDAIVPVLDVEVMTGTKTQDLAA
jgi:purine-binding chemotaxis protein CheW